MIRNGGTEQQQGDSGDSVGSVDSDVEEGPAVDAGPHNGEVIRGTAYSKVFVLRILMKFADLKVFKKAMKTKYFEKELSTLLEMTADRDVVLFLLQHDALDMLSFTMPVIKRDGRISELVVAIISNMCCQKETVAVLITDKTTISFIMSYLRTNHTAAINHALRILSHCIFLTEEEQRKTWIDVFEEFNYTESLCFILKNSSNKDLLITALENFNTLCEYLNVESLRKDFFKQFVTPEVLEAVSVAFNEIMTKQRRSFSERDSLERVLAITLQIGLNLVWFDKTPQIYSENRSSVVTMISQILGYYEHKIVNYKLIDTDVEHIFKSASLILTTLNVSEISDPNKFFFPGYRIWQALTLKRDKFGEPLTKEDEIRMVDQSIYEISEFLCIYLAQCTDEDFADVLNTITDDYRLIMKPSLKPQQREHIESRADEYNENKQLSLV